MTLALRCCLCIIAAVPLAAQITANLAGVIRDETGAPVPSTHVIVASSATGLTRATSTDQTGLYRFPALPVGSYELRIEHSGFQTVVRREVVLAVAHDVQVDSTLVVDTLPQRITVQSDAPMLSVSTASTAGLIEEREIRDLPLNGRSFDELMTLSPAVVNFTSQKTGGVGVSNSTAGNNFAVSGNRPQQNLYLLNGIEFTGAAENNMQPGGVSQQLLGVDAVKEFNILRDSYDAAYGKHPGAQVVMVTNSGSNELHGSTYEFLRNNDLDARNFFDGASAPGFQRNQYGVALGGPLKKDKAFLFGNWEELRQHLHQTGVDLVPDNNARAGFLPCSLVTPAPRPCPASGQVFVGVSKLIDAWPAPTAGAPDFGGISEAFNSPLQTIRDDFGTVRSDVQLTGNDTLSGSYTADDSAAFTPTSTNLYSTDVTSLREQVATLEETHVFSPRLLNVARVGFSRAAYFFTGEPTPGSRAATLPGFLQGEQVGAIVVGGSAASNPTAQIALAGSNNGSNLDVARNLYTFEDRLWWTAGRHQLDFGIWMQPFQSNELIALSQYGQATFTSLQTLLQGTAASLLIDPAPTPMSWRSFFAAWYAQDVYRLTPRLTVTLGLRAESTTGWNEAHGRAANYSYSNGVIASQPVIGHSAFTKNRGGFLPQPRVGLAWSPSQSHTIIRAGFGMYNDLQDALGYRMDQNAPFNPTYSIPNAAVASFPLSRTAPLPATARLVPGGTQPDLYTPTLISWSFRVERELGFNTALSLGYIGSHGYHELIGVDANEPFPVICPNAACPAGMPAGTYYVPTSVRANPALANTWTYFSEGDSSYNACEASINRRWSHGLSVRGAFTWSKAIDDGDSLNATTSGGEPALVSNPFNLKVDRGLANFNAQYVGVFAASYTKRGWTANSIVTLQSGFPFTPQLSYNPSRNGDTRNPVRPNVNPAFTGPVILGKANGWFNPAAFTAPPVNSGLYGTLGRDTLIGPGLATWDFSLLKDLPLRERIHFQIRGEVFNVLNHTNFNQPNAVVFTPSGVSPTAGLITSTTTSSRQIQFGAKLLF